MVWEDDIVPEISMLADETRHELDPILPCIPYRGMPRHTPQRTLHGGASDVRHRRPYYRGGGPSSRACPLTFVSARKRRGERNGPHLCVTSIDGLKLHVGDDLRRGAVNGGGRMTIDHYPK